MLKRGVYGKEKALHAIMRKARWCGHVLVSLSSLFFFLNCMETNWFWTEAVPEIISLIQPL